MKLTCTKCGGKKFSIEDATVKATVRNEIVDVTILSNVCNDCKHPTLDSRQMGELQKRAADVYRMKHGLLTSEQIITSRKKLGMNQEEFSEYLQVGSSSVKRWELGAIQDKSQNKLMLLTTDYDVALCNLNTVRKITKFQNEICSTVFTSTTLSNSYERVINPKQRIDVAQNTDNSQEDLAI